MDRIELANTVGIKINEFFKLDENSNLLFKVNLRDNNHVDIEIANSISKETTIIKNLCSSDIASIRDFMRNIRILFPNH